MRFEDTFLHLYNVCGKKCQLDKVLGKKFTLKNVYWDLKFELSKNLSFEWHFLWYFQNAEGQSKLCVKTLEALECNKYIFTEMAAKKLSGTLKMYIAAGKAAPSPPLGPALGQVSCLFFSLT